jgi:hypothetical protein
VREASFASFASSRIGSGLDSESDRLGDGHVPSLETQSAHVNQVDRWFAYFTADLPLLELVAPRYQIGAEASDPNFANSGWGACQEACVS